MLMNLSLRAPAFKKQGILTTAPKKMKVLTAQQRDQRDSQSVGLISSPGNIEDCG